MASTINQTTSPLDIKDRGNRLFAKSKYYEAATLYASAIKVLKEEEKGASTDLTREAQYLKAVCLSNLSNCWFELGKYDLCIKEANHCLDILVVLKDQEDATEATKLLEDIKRLRYKNLLRMARAEFYLKQFKGSMGYLNDLVSCDHEAYAKRAKRMLQQLSFYNTMSKGSAATVMM